MNSNPRLEFRGRRTKTVEGGLLALLIVWKFWAASELDLVAVLSYARCP